MHGKVEEQPAPGALQAGTLQARRVLAQPPGGGESWAASSWVTPFRQPVQGPLGPSGASALRTGSVALALRAVTSGALRSNRTPV